MTAIVAPLSNVSSAGPTRYERDEKPWKYTGYPGFCNFLAADNEWLVIRRFDELHVRIVLIMQDEISMLEEDLKVLDAKYSAKLAKDYNNGTIRNEEENRKAILLKIRDKLDKYDTAVLHYAQLRSHSLASKRSIASIGTWLNNNNGAIMEEESKYIEHTEDLIAIHTQKHSVLRRLCNPWIPRLSKNTLWMFRKDKVDDFGSINEATIHLSDDQAVDRFANILTVITGLSLLIAPLWILQAVENLRWKLGVITIFLILFFIILSFCTTGTPNQIMAATAGYAAVLVVFLQPSSAST